MKKLYCFDFDGTLTHKDTMFLFLKFYNSKKFRIQFLKHIPLFLLLRMKLLEAESVKKSFIGSVLKGEKKSKIESKSQDFFDVYYPKIIRQSALEFINNWDKENIDAVLVTASLDIWVKPFADYWDFKLISTVSQFENEIFTGDFVGNNCNEEEKVARIKSEIDYKKYDKIVAFGDTSSDYPMLNWANESFFRYFH